MIFPWPWFMIYMFTSFTGYEDDIFHVILNFHIQRSRFGRKSDNFGGYSKNSWVHGACFFQLQGTLDLVEPGQHQVSRGVVVRIVEGKLRAEALLNPGWQTLLDLTAAVIKCCWEHLVLYLQYPVHLWPWSYQLPNCQFPAPAADTLLLLLLLLLLSLSSFAMSHSTSFSFLFCPIHTWAKSCLVHNCCHRTESLGSCMRNWLAVRGKPLN